VAASGIIAAMPSSAGLGAILTAMVTPLDADLAVNEAATRRLARHLVEHGSDGLVVNGTTGESATLADDEKLRVLDVVIDEVGGEATVLAGTGSNDTAHSVHLTRAATERGANGVLVVTPYYNKPSRRGLKAHFEAVAAATDKPLLVYNIPARCVINLEPDLLAELAAVPNIVGVKQANSDMAQARAIVEDAGLDLYAGDDNLLRSFAEIGGAGGVCVSSHLVGTRMKEMYEAAVAGDDERARAIDDELADVYETLFFTASPAPVKAALNLLGFEAGGCRLPIADLTDDELPRVSAMLEAHGLVASAA
jgi:4-hydroxy-tetrahydrodipicolinate synthase